MEHRSHAFFNLTQLFLFETQTELTLEVEERHLTCNLQQGVTYKFWFVVDYDCGGLAVLDSIDIDVPGNSLFVKRNFIQAKIFSLLKTFHLL